MNTSSNNKRGCPSGERAIRKLQRENDENDSIEEMLALDAEEEHNREHFILFLGFITYTKLFKRKTEINSSS